MSFDVGAPDYARFMGRFSEPLAVEFGPQLQLRADQRALDVGCGPGALTGYLVEQLGADAVSAVDPSTPFVAAAAQRFPGIDVRRAAAEALPFTDDEFDIAAAQLVVHFLTDPVAGLQEMARVVRPGGLVAACVWDHAGGSGPLSLFWRAVHDLDGTARDESDLPGAREGHLATLCRAAGLRDIEASTLTVHVSFASFAAWWAPFTLGVGPAGVYVGRLEEAGREALRARCADLVPTAPFVVDASAWSVRARSGPAAPSV